MRLTEFMVVVVAALMFLVPTMKNEKTAFEARELQEEEVFEEEMLEEGSFRITYESKSPMEEDIVDIIWMKKAAELAEAEGVPHFNVVEQNRRRQYSDKFNQYLSIIEGVIHLDPDPMRAEFDAKEITSLVLTD